MDEMEGVVHVYDQIVGLTLEGFYMFLPPDMADCIRLFNQTFEQFDQEEEDFKFL